MKEEKMRMTKRGRQRKERNHKMERNCKMAKMKQDRIKAIKGK